MATCREINARLWKQSKQGFRFDDTHLPHISIAQLYLAVANLRWVSNAVEHAMQPFRPLLLTVSGTSVQEIDNSEVASAFSIEPVPDLMRFHQIIMEAVRPFETSGDGRAFLTDPGESVWTGSINWVTNFRQNKQRQGFHPHITLGIGMLTNAEFPPPFFADRVAICHLGNFNTCRKILWEGTLRGD